MKSEFCARRSPNTRTTLAARRRGFSRGFIERKWFFARGSAARRSAEEDALVERALFFEDVDDCLRFAKSMLFAGVAVIFSVDAPLLQCAIEAFGLARRYGLVLQALEEDDGGPDGICAPQRSALAK